MPEERIHLELASRKHRQAAIAFKQEFFDAGETVINGSALFDQMGFDEWICNCERNNHPETVREDWAVASTFFGVRDSDGAIAGMIDVRHSLATPFLQQYGGHIGYSVRPSERRKGYATAMLQLALDFCRSIGLDAVRIGCYSDNAASIGVIIACGGALIEEKPYLDGKDMQMYRITL